MVFLIDEGAQIQPILQGILLMWGVLLVLRRMVLMLLMLKVLLVMLCVLRLQVRMYMRLQVAIVLVESWIGVHRDC